MKNFQAISERVNDEMQLIWENINILNKSLTDEDEFPAHPPLAMAQVLHQISCNLTEELDDLDDAESVVYLIHRSLVTAWFLGEQMYKNGHPVESLQECLCFSVDDDELEKLLTDGK